MSDHNHDETAKFAIDLLSLTLLLGVLSDFLPVVASLLTIAWTAIRIAETETMRRLWRWWRGR